MDFTGETPENTIMDSYNSVEESKSTRSEAADDSCHFYIERKKRYCRFKPSKNSKYCAEHVTAFETSTERKRMLCPYDSKHTCYVDKLKHHLNRCPSRPKEMPAYYSKGINSGDDGGEHVPNPKVTVLTVSTEELQNIIYKVNQLYDAYIKEIPVSILSHPCLREEVENTTYGTAALRHRRQMASLIGHMEKLDLLRDNLCYVEMGAGKGQLTHWLHSAVDKKDNNSFVLIDRSHVRNKMDNLHKEEDIMKRYRIDIENLKLGRIPAIENADRPVVAFGKHLCGPATDLALRCATETVMKEVDGACCYSDQQNQKKKRKTEERLAGCVIALCCHHRCTWPAYVGKAFLQSCGLTARDFQLLSSMSSWATCTWKGWSLTKKTEEDQMKRKNEDINSEKLAGKDMTNHKGHGHVVVDKCESYVEIVPGNTEITEEVTDHTEVTSKNNDVINNEKQVSCDDIEISSSDMTGNEQRWNEEETAKVFCEPDPDEDHEDARNHSLNISIKCLLSENEREVIGRKCKHLIDYGRVKYLEDHGLLSSLQVYIEDFYTPENVVLLATQK